MQHHPSARSSRIPFLAALITAATAPAQTPDWASIDVSPAAVVQLEQSYALARDGNVVHAFSALNGNWTSLTTFSGAPVITRANDHFIVRDGPVFHAYCPRTTSYSAQATFSAGATLLAQSSPQTWHSIVVDGNDVHIYFALQGYWQTLVFASPPAISNGRFCIMIQDGANVLGISSFYGSTVSLGVPGATSLGAFGCFGLATSPGAVHGFSGYLNTWSQYAAGGMPTVSSWPGQPGFAALRYGTDFVFYSGHRGSFLLVTAAATATIQVHRQVGVVLDASQVTCYSGLLGTAATVTLGGTPTVTMHQYYAILVDGIALTPYSAANGAFGPPFPGQYNIQVGAQLAVATPVGSTTPAAVYTSFRNVWVGTPPIVNPSSFVTGCAVMLIDPLGGIYGLGARGDSWVFEPTPVIDNGYAGGGALSGTLCARSGNTLYAFNPRTLKWRSTTTAATAGNFQGQNAAMILRDGINVYGFSNNLDRWSSVPLAGAVVSSMIQVQSAVVFDGVRVHGYAGVGQVSTIGEFPDFWRAMSLGGRFRIDLAGEPGAQALLALSAAAAEIPAPPFGTLLIDPASMLILAQLALPANGLFGLTIQIPNIPALSGAQFHFQAGIVGPNGVYLTNSAVATIL